MNILLYSGDVVAHNGRKMPMNLEKTLAGVMTAGVLTLGGAGMAYAAPTASPAPDRPSRSNRRSILHRCKGGRRSHGAILHGAITAEVRL